MGYDKKPNKPPKLGSLIETKFRHQKKEGSFKKTPKISNWEFSKIIYRFALSEKWRLLTGITSMFLTSWLGLRTPKLLGEVVGAISDRKELVEIHYLIKQMALTTFLYSICVYIRRFSFTTAGERLIVKLSKDLFNAVLYQPVGFFECHNSGEITARLSDDIPKIKNILRDFPNLLRSVCVACGGLFYIFSLSWKLTLVMVSCFLPVLAIIKFFSFQTRRVVKSAKRGTGTSSAIASETFSNIRTVKSCNAEEELFSLFSSAIQSTYSSRETWVREYSRLQSLTHLFLGLGVCILSWFGSELVLRQQSSFTIGSLTSYFFYIKTIGSEVESAISTFSDIIGAIGASERVLLLLKEEVRMEGLHPQTTDCIIEFSNVSFHYPTRPEIKVLSDFSMKLTPGKVIALVGSSGAGKSTVVNLIEKFYAPTQGTIYWDNYNINDLHPQWVRSKIGYVSQDAILFSGTIRQNLILGNKNIPMEDVELAVKQAFVDEFISHLPQGYETRVGEKGMQISGGQKQRLVIARALVKKPPILILDEATSSLDSESEHQVQLALDALMSKQKSKRKECSMLVIAHRLSTIKEADEVIVLQNGQIREKGTHNELIKLHGIYASLLKHQITTS